MMGMCDDATAYAARGWRIFPCRPGAKTPATEHGFKDATSERARLREWWARAPDANIALATGRASGVFVIDIDVKAGALGYDNWGALCKAHNWRSSADVVAASTPSGGAHVYFSYVEGVTNARGALPDGVDVRGDGGYVLLPPSRLDGYDRPYTWLFPKATAVMTAPAWLLEVLRARPEPQTKSKTAQEGIARVLAEARQGERNARLFWAACRLFDHGATFAEVEEKLFPQALSLGLNECETRATIRSAEKQERRLINAPRRFSLPTVEQQEERRRRFMRPG